MRDMHAHLTWRLNFGIARGLTALELALFTHTAYANKNGKRMQLPTPPNPQLPSSSIIKENQGQCSVSKQQRHTQGPAQLNSIRHSITKTGIAQQRQAQPNTDRHSITKTGTAQYGQAQRNKDRHSRTKTGTAEQRQAQLSLRKTGNQAF